MKRIITLTTLFLFGIVQAQVGINTTTPHSSSMLDVTSTSKGFLAPRMTKAQRDLITTPATGLLIYQTDDTPTFYYYNGAAWVPFGGSYTFTNGLNETATVAKLGGALTQQTAINTNGTNYLKISTPTKTEAFYVDPVNEAVYFGKYTASTIWDGDPYDVDGYTGNVELISKSHNGTSRGSGVGIGSIEYLMDGESTIATSDTFIPLEDDWYNLGSSDNRWTSVYATDGTVSTSDARFKKDIKNLNYGLEEIMKLKPVTFRWKKDHIGKTKIPDNLQKTKIGFLAQDLLEVIPEVVVTHEWKKTDETKKNEFEYTENNKLGVMYSDIIPVIVKALQEQQTIIANQQKEIDLLKMSLKMK